MRELRVNHNTIIDATNIRRGVYAPLGGFLGEADFRSVLDRMRLADGAVWPIPIVVDIDEAEFKALRGEKCVALDDGAGGRAVLDDIEAYPYDKAEFARQVYGTEDTSHPGVAELAGMGDYLLGGRVVCAERPASGFAAYEITPEEARRRFANRGWKTVAAFQTRNVPHRGHEFLQQEALKQVDGLFIQPVIGEKKLQDFKDEYIVSAYEILIDKYHPRGRAMLGVLPLKMRYAGPREAMMHALIRRNYGCTHFIVGRDHAGAGDFYTPTAAQEIFGQFDPGEVGIEILKYGEAVYDRARGRHCFAGECKEPDKEDFSGTRLREHIKNKTRPPKHLIRPDIYDHLVNSYNSLVDNTYKKSAKQSGFVLWFTGLSGSGKTTLADRVYQRLAGNGTRIERLDGDIVREYLTQDLGFTREDRNENIKRIGFVARMLAQNGVGVVASFISPYREHRDPLKKEIDNFFEIFVDAPLEVCERRDPKGLYQKARDGKIRLFTGIDDPYEPPDNPDIHLRTDKLDEAECEETIMKYLRDRGVIH